MPKCILLLILLFAGLFNIALCADSDSIYEQYFTSTINGEKVGYSFVEQKLTQYNNQNVILTHKHTQQQIKKFGLPVEIIQDINFYETTDLKPLRVEFSSKSADTKTTSALDFSDNGKTFISVQNSSPKEFALAGNILFPCAIEKLFKEKTKEPVIEYTTIDPENNFRPVEIKATKDKGHYNISLNILPNVQNSQWRDIQGRIIKEYSSFLGIEQTLSTKDEAISTITDVFEKSKISTEGKISNIKSVKEITYKLSLASFPASSLPDFINSQRIIQIKNNTAYIKVKQRSYKDQVFKYPPKNKNAKTYLKPTLYLDYQDKEIELTTAKQLHNVNKDSYKIAKTLANYVNKEIKTQPNKTKIKKASQTLTDKCGDKTDKTILLAAMLRKAHIPARIVVGVKYETDPETSFNYHPWVVAKIGDEWASLDESVFEQDLSTVDYIALADADFALNKPIDEQLIGYLDKLSKMKINFLDFSLVEAIAPSDIDNSVKLSDMGIFDYIKNAGLSADEIDYKKASNDDRKFLQLSNLSSQKYLNQAYNAYMKNDIDASVSNFEKAFDLTPINDDYLNIDYANKLSSLGLFTLAKSRLANISDYQIWENKIENLYKMYLPKITPDANEEKICAGILSRTSYNVESLDLHDIENTFNNKYKKSDYINYVLARVYFVKKDDKKALRYINKAISQNPNNYLYRILKANILASKQNYNAAVNELSTLLERNINDRELAYGIKLHKYYMLSLKSKNPAEKNYNLARFYLMSSQEERAKQIILKNIETRKSLSDYNLLARVYFNSSDFANARQTYEKALTIKEKDITATEGLGNIAYIQHNYKQACEQYEKALSYNKKSDKLLLKIANCKRDMSDDKQALELYYQVLNLDPENFFAMYNISQINKNDAESKAIYKKILSINPNFAPAWLGLTRAALIEKNTFLARQYLLNMSHINNSNPIYYYYSGLIEVMDENYSYARRDFNTALQLNPNFTPAKVELEKLR